MDHARKKIRACLLAVTALAVLLGAVWYVQDALDSVDVTEGTLVHLDGGASDLWTAQSI